MRKVARIKADEMEHFLYAGGRARGIPVFQSGDKGDVLRNREMGKEAGLLDDITDAAAEANGVPFCRGAILDEDYAFGGK